MLKTETILEIKEFPLCANFDCQNRLTEYELNRNRRIVRNHFCRGCRYKRDRIVRIRCGKCGTLVNSTGHKLLCDNCVLIKRKKQQALSVRVKLLRIGIQKMSQELEKKDNPYLKLKIEYYYKILVLVLEEQKELNGVEKIY